MKTGRSQGTGQDTHVLQPEMADGLRILARIIARRLARKTGAEDSDTATKPEEIPDDPPSSGG